MWFERSAGKEIMDKLVELKNKSKVTLIVASHGPFIGTDADRCLYLKAGRLVAKICGVLR